MARLSKNSHAVHGISAGSSRSPGQQGVVGAGNPAGASVVQIENSCLAGAF
jgi:hypothetical protein